MADSRNMLRVFVLVAGLGASVSGMTLVNRANGKCLDVRAACVDGSADESCQKVSAEALTAGTALQLLDCNMLQSQEFEYLSSGRIRHNITGLCMDIVAPCKDHARMPCERLPVDKLKGHAKVQLFKCHKDVGVLSNSYGNQKWDFQRGQLRNSEASLCLGPLQQEQQAVGEVDIMEVETCTAQEEYQQFDWLRAAPPVKTQQVHALFDAKATGITDHSWSHASLVFAFVSMGLLATGTFIARRTHRPLEWSEPVPMDDLE